MICDPDGRVTGMRVCAVVEARLVNDVSRKDRRGEITQNTQKVGFRMSLRFSPETGRKINLFAAFKPELNRILPGYGI